MKKLNNGKQMRSDWGLNICLGEERLKDADGKSLHNTQKPMDLLRRIILASTRPGDVILDPFLGSGTTAAAAKELGRRFIGIERDAKYVAGAIARVNAVQPADLSKIEVAAPKREEARVAFGELIATGLLHVGQTLVGARGDRVIITHDGQVQHTLLGRGSIHVMAARIQRSASFNGWDYWSAEKRDGALVSIDDIRKYARALKKELKEAA
jgi:modification methylase